ncbi:putative PB1 domain-containing protein [Helianthus anomalus]
MRLRCKLPHDDLDSLVHVKSDEDLAYVLEEYDQCKEDLKIRAILDDTLRFSWADDLCTVFGLRILRCMSEQLRLVVDGSTTS